jgi:serine O-acetyltransferase
MIKTYKELKDYLNIEAKKLNIKYFIIQYLTGSEFARIYHFMWVLRHLELFSYKKQSSKLYLLPYCLFYIWHRRLRIKYGIHLGPGDAKKGFHLVHLGFIRCYNIAKLGENCTMLPMVLFGKKKPGIGEGYLIQVGDNCYFGAGCTILGPCKIGNNVTVAAGAVVTKDVPDNSIIAGVPAKKIGINN